MDCDGLKHALLIDEKGTMTDNTKFQGLVASDASYFSPKAVGAIPPYHMFTSGFVGGCGLHAWETNSQVCKV